MTKWDDSPKYRVPVKVLGVWETCASKSDEQVFKSLRSVVCETCLSHSCGVCVSVVKDRSSCPGCIHHGQSPVGLWGFYRCRLQTAHCGEAFCHWRYLSRLTHKDTLVFLNHFWGHCIYSGCLFEKAPKKHFYTVLVLFCFSILSCLCLSSLSPL